MLFDTKKRIESRSASGDTEVKRGRGRPPKDAPAQEPTSVEPVEEKRGRGRPRKEPVAAIETVADQPKRGRGRPRKEPTPTVEVTEKRGRGRPRKEPAPVIQPEPTEPKRGRGRPRKEVAEAPAVVAQTEAQEPRRGRGRPRKDVQPTPIDVAIAEDSEEQSLVEQPSTSELITIDLQGWEELPIPVFRKRQARSQVAIPALKSSSEDKELSETAPGEARESSEDSARRRNRRRGRGRGRDRDQERPEAPISDQETAPEELEIVAASKPEPVITEREVLRIPSDAPQIVPRAGVPTLVRDGVVYPPIFFFGNALDERRLETVLEQIKYANDAGVGVIVHNIELEVGPGGEADDAVSFAGFLLKKTLSVAPQAQVIFRVVFTATTGWEARYPKARYVAENGGIGEPSLCDESFWRDAEACLEDFIIKMRQLPDSPNVMGVHLERGEWFFASGWGYDTSLAAQESFRDWVRVRYRNDNVALCASWFDGQAQFETLTVPEFLENEQRGDNFIRTGRKSRRWVDYHLFLSDITVDRIGRLAQVAKRASEGYFLVGVSYGYTFEWSHPANGHLSLGKLLRTPEVDFIAGPPSYKNREPGGTCPFPGPIDSISLNGKLYVSEEDFKTPISGKEEPDDFNPAMKTPQSLESVHWRGLGAAVAHSAGVCWMDLWGNGWLKSPGIWDRARSVRKALLHRMTTPPSDPDVAVFIDERSLSYLVDQRAFALLVQNVRESILRSGLSAGFFLLSDLAHRENFPEAKLYVFLNAWDIRPEVRSAIKSRLQRDNKVLFWMYSAGLFDAGRDALERVREVTGIALKKQPFASRSGTSIVHKKHPLCEALPERNLGVAGELEPSYFAIPEDGIVLGEYTSTGLPSFVLREFEGPTAAQRWTSVFLGEPVVTPGFFRALGQLAGAHIWNHQEDVVHVRAPFVTVHCTGTGQRTLTLPDKAVAYNVQRDQWANAEGSQLRLNVVDGQTMSYLVGLRSEIETILQKPESELLSIDALPERPENTIRLDSIHFDVPIMRVDTWLEEGWTEESAGDLILKPSQLEESAADAAIGLENGADQEDRRQRSRGRRRRGRKGGPEKSNQVASDFDISEMNVVFRKRE